MTKKDKEVLFEILDVLDSIRLELPSITARQQIDDKLTDVWSKVNDLEVEDE